MKRFLTCLCLLIGLSVRAANPSFGDLSNGPVYLGSIIQSPGTSNSLGVVSITGLLSDTNIINGAVNIRSLGAVGDGVNDDTLAINTALTNFESIFFPPGTYQVSSPLNLTELARHHLVGTFPAQVTIRATNWTGGPIFDVTGASYDIFENFVVSTSGPTNPTCAFLLARNAANGSAGSHYFNFIRCNGSYSNAVMVVWSSEENAWRRCIFTTATNTPAFIGMSDDTGRVIASAYDTLGTGAGGNSLNLFDSCQFWDQQVGQTNPTVILRGCTEWNFKNCYFLSYGTNEIQIEQGLNGNGGAVFPTKNIIIDTAHTETYGSSTNTTFYLLNFVGSGLSQNILVQNSSTAGAYGAPGHSLNNVSFKDCTQQFLPFTFTNWLNVDSASNCVFRPNATEVSKYSYTIRVAGANNQFVGVPPSYVSLPATNANAALNTSGNSATDLFQSWSSVNVAAGASDYWPYQGYDESSGPNIVDQVAPRSMTVSNFWIYLQAATLFGTNLTWALYTNNGPTTLSVIIPAGVTIASNVTASVFVPAGTLLSWSCAVNDATAVSIRPHWSWTQFVQQPPQ